MWKLVRDAFQEVRNHGGPIHGWVRGREGERSGARVSDGEEIGEERVLRNIIKEGGIVEWEEEGFGQSGGLNKWRGGIGRRYAPLLSLIYIRMLERRYG